MITAAHRAKIDEMSDKALAVAIITAAHLLVFTAINWTLRTRAPVEDRAVVTYLTLLPAKPPARPAAEAARPQPEVDGIAPPASAVIAPAAPVAIRPVVSRPGQVVRSAVIMPKHSADPCPPSRLPADGRQLDPACGPAVRPAPAPLLQLPGGLEQDAFGNIVPNPAGSALPWPAGSPDQQREDAARFEAAAVRLFGPPNTPALPPWADDPAHNPKRGPLIQFIRDRRNSAPLTPQSALGAPPPTYDIPDWFPTSSIVQ